MRDFGREYDVRFKVLFRIAVGIIITSFLFTLGTLIFMGVVAYKAGDEIQEKGLKSVVERIWCGPDNHCL